MIEAIGLSELLNGLLVSSSMLAVLGSLLHGFCLPKHMVFPALLEMITAAVLGQGVSTGEGYTSSTQFKGGPNSSADCFALT